MSTRNDEEVFIPEAAAAAAAAAITPSLSAMSTTELDRGHRVGNFWSYPDFNPAKNRMRLIPAEAFEEIAAFAVQKAEVRKRACETGNAAAEYILLTFLKNVLRLRRRG